MESLDQQLDNTTAENKELETLLQAANEKLDYAHAEIKQLRDENEQLKAEAKTAEEKAAEFYGASMPPVPAGYKSSDSVVGRFKAITDPNKQTAFLRTLDEREKAELYSNI